MSFVKASTMSHAGDEVMAFEQLLLRFETMVGDCNKELRAFNELSLTLGKDHVDTRENLAKYSKCQDVSNSCARVFCSVRT